MNDFWRKLPVLITIGSLIVGFIVFIVTISNKTEEVEGQHTRIESTIIRIEEKLDKLYESFIK